jgi:hypothetical protein
VKPTRQTDSEKPMSALSMLQTERSLHYIFSVLARCVKSSDQSARVNIPETLFYQHGSLRIWYSSDAETGDVVKRDKRDCTKDRIIDVLGAAPDPAAVCDGVSRNTKHTAAVAAANSSKLAASKGEGSLPEAPPDMPVAMYVRLVAASASRVAANRRGGTASALDESAAFHDHSGEPLDVLSVEYFDRGSLIAFLENNREPKHNAILQRFTHGKTRHASTVQVLWSPHQTIVTQRKNLHALTDTAMSLYERCNTMEDAPHVSREVKTTPRMISQLAAECGRVVAHVSAVEQRQVLRMVAFYAFDSRQKPSLLWVSEIQLTGIPMSAGDIHRGLAKSRQRQLLYISPATMNGAQSGLSATGTVQLSVDALLQRVVDPFAKAGGASGAMASSYSQSKRTTREKQDDVRRRRVMMRPRFFSPIPADAAPVDRAEAVRRPLSRLMIDGRPASAMSAISGGSQERSPQRGLQYCAGGGGGYYMDKARRPDSALRDRLLSVRPPSPIAASNDAEDDADGGAFLKPTASLTPHQKHAVRAAAAVRLYGLLPDGGVQLKAALAATDATFQAALAAIADVTACVETALAPYSAAMGVNVDSVEVVLSTSIHALLSDGDGDAVGVANSLRHILRHVFRTGGLPLRRSDAPPGVDVDTQDGEVVASVAAAKTAAAAATALTTGSAPLPPSKFKAVGLVWRQLATPPVVDAEPAAYADSDDKTLPSKAGSGDAAVMKTMVTGMSPMVLRRATTALRQLSCTLQGSALYAAVDVARCIAAPHDGGVPRALAALEEADVAARGVTSEWPPRLAVIPIAV